MNRRRLSYWAIATAGVCGAVFALSASLVSFTSLRTPAVLTANATRCPARPVPALRFDPVDLTSGVDGNAAVSVRVDNLGQPVDPGLLAEIATTLRLVRWPSGELIPAKIQTTNADDLPDAAEDRPKGAPLVTTARIGAGRSEASVTVVPDATLAAGWYALQLDATPGAARWPAEAVKVDDGGDVTLSRFHVGSNPLVTSVQLCEKEDNKQVVLIDYSERVRPRNGNALGLAHQDGRAASCRGGAGNREETAQHTLICNAFAKGDGKVRVDLGGLVSATGLGAVAVPPGARAKGTALDLDFDTDLTSAGENCRIVRL
jgi:hypothetical protein